MEEDGVASSSGEVRYNTEIERVLVEVNRQFLGQPLRDNVTQKLYEWMLVFEMRKNTNNNETKSCGMVIVKKPYAFDAARGLEVECESSLSESEKEAATYYFHHTFSLTTSVIIKKNPLLPMLIFVQEQSDIGDMAME